MRVFYCGLWHGVLGYDSWWGCWILVGGSGCLVLVGARERMLVVVNIWGCLIVVIGFVI